MNFHTPGRVDVEPPSVADSLREYTAASLRAWQVAVDVDVVDDIEDEVVEIFFPPSYPSSVVKIFFFGLSEQRSRWLLHGCPPFFPCAQASMHVAENLIDRAQPFFFILHVRCLDAWNLLQCAVRQLGSIITNLILILGELGPQT
jgi:hypothetical protein